MARTPESLVNRRTIITPKLARASAFVLDRCGPGQVHRQGQHIHWHTMGQYEHLSEKPSCWLNLCWPEHEQQSHVVANHALSGFTPQADADYVAL